MSLDINPKSFERFVQQLAKQPRIARDTRALGYMTEIYCKGKHPSEEKQELNSYAVQAGCYAGHRIPWVCTECAHHIHYGELRRALCPHTPKPSCQMCEQHCYKPQEAQFQKDSMRYAGPRAIFTKELIYDALYHAYQNIKTKLHKN